jgi:hypothetical protein
MGRRNFFFSLGFFLILGGHVFSSHPSVTLGGSYLGIFNARSPLNNTAHFDYASNVDMRINFSPNVEGVVQLQSSPGGGDLGFPGPEFVLTDIVLTYVYDRQNFSATFGSFDLPIGRNTLYLTNNADAFSSQFVINSLFYSALAGPVGTLNTLGLKLEKKWGSIDSTWVVSNGSGEDARNASSAFLGLVSLGVPFENEGYFSVSLVSSNDAEDADTSTSFHSYFSVGMMDLEYSLFERWKIKKYAGRCSYDARSMPSKGVFVYGVEVSYNFSPIIVAYRQSAWNPDNPSENMFLNDILSDNSVTRYQAGLTYIVTSDVFLRADVYRDDYLNSSQVHGVVVGINGRF